MACPTVMLPERFLVDHGARIHFSPKSPRNGARETATIRKNILQISLNELIHRAESSTHGGELHDDQAQFGEAPT